MKITLKFFVNAQVIRKSQSTTEMTMAIDFIFKYYNHGRFFFFLRYIYVKKNYNNF